MSQPLRNALLLAALADVTYAATAYSQTADDHLQICTNSNQACDVNRQVFKNDLPKALKGNYQAQRNVAYCFASGCDGAVVTNLPLGCAWSLVTINSGDHRVGDADIRFFKTYCQGKLSDLQGRQMNAQAAALFERVYRRPLPKSVDFGESVLQ